MVRKTTCDWCGEPVYFVTIEGRLNAMQDGNRHCCREGAIGATFSVGARKRNPERATRYRFTRAVAVPSRQFHRIGGGPAPPPKTRLGLLAKLESCLRVWRLSQL